jgi:inosine-uridine nucleoside N-ribohydrolase
LPIEGTDGYAEYNFATDPDAAQIVFKSGIKNITLVGLNVTRSVLYNKDVEARLKACGGRCAVKAAEILSTVGEDDLQDYGALRQTPDDPVRAMHDVLAMAYCDRPEMFTSEILPIDIVAGEPPEVSGQTLISRGREPHHPAVRVVTSVNKDDFLNRMIENIARLP